ncbi:MAG TPA: 4Fe-4S binding protein [Clostridia bacterium]|nr:4Fe-4S binding protein [Clostridia bacterium]
MTHPIDLMGLRLKNPIMTASGPWAGDAAGIQRCIDAGAAAVITETISLEAKPRISPRLFTDDKGLFNIMLYSRMHLEEWELEFSNIDRKDSKLICSIWGATASEIAYLAKKVQQMGADAIEISISAPIGSRNLRMLKPSTDIREFMKAAVNAVDIPVMTKLSYEAASSPEFLHELELAGIRAVSAIDALKGLVGVDIENRLTLMPTYGGYTGQHIRPVSLATTAALQQYTPLQVVSSGGVLDHKTVLEFLMLGATAVQLASAILCNGYEIIADVVRDLDRWLTEHDHMNVDAIRGSALPSLRAFEDIIPKSLYASLKEKCCRTECSICIQNCLRDAISYDKSGTISIDPDQCDGCGLCVERCPHGLVTLEWR